LIGTNGILFSRKIQPLPEGSIIPYSEMEEKVREQRDQLRGLLDQLVVVKLNGGLVSV
jgi:hypothetical protein